MVIITLYDVSVGKKQSFVCKCGLSFRSIRCVLIHVILFLTGFSISMVEDDSVQQLYITDVKAGGLAFAKGLLLLFSA